MAQALRASGVRVGVCVAPETPAQALRSLLSYDYADGWLIELGNALACTRLHATHSRALRARKARPTYRAKCCQRAF